MGYSEGQYTHSMKINFLMNDVSYMDYETQTAHWGWEPTDKRLGGTEESVVQWAEELSRRDHKVTVFLNMREESPVPYNHNGVRYCPKQAYPHEVKADICINIKNSEVKPLEPTLYLTNETDADTLDLSPYLGVIWPSQWAVDNIPVNNRTFIVPHGYDDKKINSQKKINKQCLYASSPDRGVDILAQIWPAVVEQHPDAHLYVTYGGQINTPNTTCGEFTDDEMNELFNTSEFWLHPCTGGELYGMSGIKAQAAWAIPVYFPTMALSETVQEGVACNDAREMYNVLCALLGNEEAKEAYREDLAKLTLPNWERSTDRLLEVINSVI